MDKGLLEIAIKASVDAGKVIMDIYDTDFDVAYKQDESPLTIADQSANTVINSYLLKTEIPIISEENKQADYSTRKAWSRCWIVDPLDGTKEFVKRNGEFTVNIALVENGIPKLGVIYVPERKVLYFSNNQERQAYKVTLDEHQITSAQIENAIAITPAENSKNTTIRLVGSRSHMNDDTKNFITNLETEGKAVDVVSAGSSLKFCLVAEGKADVYPRFAPTMEWDTAAGQSICEAVGVKVINKETGEPLLYNKENLLNPYFMVS